jgi:hypothetical protein
MAEKMKIFAPDDTGKQCETVGERMEITKSNDIVENYVSRTKTIQWMSSITDKDLDEAAFGKRFIELYKKWREETIVDSFIGDPYHKSYDKIVLLGYRVVPYIINKLKEEPSFMFAALERITSENPVKKANNGKPGKMIQDWIEWWEKKNNT